MNSILKAAASFGLVVTLAAAEQHIIIFDNRCGFGSPALVNNGNVLFVSTGPVHEYDAFTINTSLTNFTSFLSSGDCFVGENPTGSGCTTVHGRLALPGQGGSSIQVSAPADGGFPTSFFYTGGSAPGCWDGEFSIPGTTTAALSCPANDVNLAVRFC